MNGSSKKNCILHGVIPASLQAQLDDICYFVAYILTNFLPALVH